MGVGTFTEVSDVHQPGPTEGLLRHALQLYLNPEWNNVASEGGFTGLNTVDSV